MNKSTTSLIAGVIGLGVGTIIVILGASTLKAVNDPGPAIVVFVFFVLGVSATLRFVLTRVPRQSSTEHSGH